MAYTATAYLVVAYTVMAPALWELQLPAFEPCSLGLIDLGLCRFDHVGVVDLYSYGLNSYGLNSYGPYS